MTYRIRNWEKWQSYRGDRGQPPWIKVHRCLMRNDGWVQLTDAQRGHLVSIWLLAADRDGQIPASPQLIQKLCYLDQPPDLQLLMDLGFIDAPEGVTPERRHADATPTPERRQSDAPEAETEERQRRDRMRCRAVENERPVASVGRGGGGHGALAAAGRQGSTGPRRHQEGGRLFAGHCRPVT